MKPHYQAEFPDYPELDVWLPPGYVDTSWHNDTCPSFERTFAGGLIARILIDYPDNDEREEPDNPRFVAWGPPRPMLVTDDWAEVVAWDAQWDVPRPGQLLYKPETSWGMPAASTFNTPIRDDRGIAAAITAPVTYEMTVPGLTEAQARDIQLVLEGKLKSTDPQPIGYTIRTRWGRYVPALGADTELGVLLNVDFPGASRESLQQTLQERGWTIVPIYGEPKMTKD